MEVALATSRGARGRLRRPKGFTFFESCEDPTSPHDIPYSILPATGRRVEREPAFVGATIGPDGALHALAYEGELLRT